MREFVALILVPSTGILFLYGVMTKFKNGDTAFSSPLRGFFFSIGIRWLSQPITCSRPLYGDSFSLFIRICKLKKECAAFSSPPWGFFFSIPLDVFGYYPPGTFSSPPRGFFFSMQPQTDISTKRGWVSSPPRGFFVSRWLWGGRKIHVEVLVPSTGILFLYIEYVL